MPFSREELSHELLAKMPLNEFLMKDMKIQYEQKLKTRKHKNTFKKHIKYSKIFLDLIDKQLSINITFEHV